MDARPDDLDPAPSRAAALERLARVRPASDAALRGAGISARPLSDIFEGTSSVTAGLREVLHPTEWWLRLYYGIADTHSVRPYRVAWHPLRVGYWFARRTWQALSWQRQDA